MSENEALEYMRLFRDDWDRNSKTKNAKALDVAIQALEEMKKIKALGDCYIIPKNGTWEVNGIDIHKALEEIQQYRAIGTVEQLEWCKDASHWKELFKEKLEKYEAIGTVEDIQMIFQLCKDLQVMCGKYHEIGTVEEFKALKEKNTPKKVVSEIIPYGTKIIHNRRAECYCGHYNEEDDTYNIYNGWDVTHVPKSEIEVFDWE